MNPTKITQIGKTKVNAIESAMNEISGIELADNVLRSCCFATVLRRVRVNPRIAGTELAGTERGTPIPIPPPTRWRPSLTRNPRNTAETRGITRGPVKHSHTFGREFHSVQNLGSTIE